MILDCESILVFIIQKQIDLSITISECSLLSLCLKPQKSQVSELTCVFPTMESHWKAGSTAGKVAHHHVDTVWKTPIVWSGAVDRIQDHVTLRKGSKYIIWELLKWFLLVQRQ